MALGLEDVGPGGKYGNGSGQRTDPYTGIKDPYFSTPSPVPDYTSMLRADLAFNGGVYDNQRGFLNQGYGLDVQRNNLQGQNIQNQYGNVQNDQGRINADLGFLGQQRGLYGQIGQNELDQLTNQQGRLGIQQWGLNNDLQDLWRQNRLQEFDQGNKATAAGGFTSAGNQFRLGDIFKQKQIGEAKVQNQRELLGNQYDQLNLQKTGSQLGTQMSQLGVDKQISNANYDLKALDNRFKAIGIDAQMNQLDKKQLEMSLNQKMQQIGLDQFMSAKQLLAQASNGAGDQGAQALQLLQQLLQQGGM